MRSLSAHYDLSAYAALSLRVKGDGKRYSLRIRNGNSFSVDEISYQARFVTDRDVWQEGPFCLEIACIKAIQRVSSM